MTGRILEEGMDVGCSCRVAVQILASGIGVRVTGQMMMMHQHDRLLLMLMVMLKEEGCSGSRILGPSRVNGTSGAARGRGGGTLPSCSGDQQILTVALLTAIVARVGCSVMHQLIEGVIVIGICMVIVLTAVIAPITRMMMTVMVITTGIHVQAVREQGNGWVGIAWDLLVLDHHVSQLGGDRGTVGEGDESLTTAAASAGDATHAVIRFPDDVDPVILLIEHGHDLSPFHLKLIIDTGSEVM